LPAYARFEGVYAAAITPRRKASEEMDLSAMWELIDFLGARKINGIVLLGSTGEFPHFNVEERVRMTTLAVRRSRVPVLVNVSHSALDCAVQLGQAAVRAGAAGLLLMPPYLFRYGERDVVEFFRAFMRQTGSSVPLLLYNIPQFTSPVPASAARLLIGKATRV
jgi:4-hydroxy-tetrahydrodipicolinate synthase